MHAAAPPQRLTWAYTAPMDPSSNRDTPLHFTRSGRGPAVLFLHGFPLDHTMWDGARQALDASYDCVAPDLRGFGLSRADVGSVLTMEAHAHDAARVVGRLGLGRVHVVGLSMGGYVALALAELHPELLRSLTLVDSRAGDDGDEGRARRDAAADRLLEHGRGAFAREMLAKLVAPGASREVRAALLTTMEATPYETIAAALMGMKARPDRTHVLRSLGAPFLAVCGEQDAITPPPMSRAMAEVHPSGEVAVLPGAGHMSPMERPAEFAAILARFLARA